MELQFQLSDISTIAKQIIKTYPDQRVFCLSGDLAAGKTTLVKQLVKALGSEDDVSSPTYAIINEYHSPTKPIHHMDLYRVESIDELLVIGFEEYIDSRNYCFIEWPMIANPLLPEDKVEIQLAYVSETIRNIIF